MTILCCQTLSRSGAGRQGTVMFSFDQFWSPIHLHYMDSEINYLSKKSMCLSEESPINLGRHEGE